MESPFLVLSDNDCFVIFNSYGDEDLGIQTGATEIKIHEELKQKDNCIIYMGEKCIKAIKITKIENIWGSDYRLTTKIKAKNIHT